MSETGLAGAGGLLTIDLGAIRANYRLLRDRLDGSACAAVVKADAYGLGARRRWRRLWPPRVAGISSSRIWTKPSRCGRICRSTRSYLSSTACRRVPRPRCLEHGAIPVLNSLGQIDAWTELARQRGARCRPSCKSIPACRGLASHPTNWRLSRTTARRLDGIELATS